MSEHLLLFLALLFAVSFVGMLPPLVRRWSDRGLHNFVAASAGIFLGTVFLHLLPELAGGDAHGHGHAHAAVDSSMPWAAALVGFLGLFLIEKVWMRDKPGADGHTLVWVSTYVGLSVHAFTAGLGLAALLEHPELSVAVVAILWHKLTECFSLSSVMRLAGAPAKRHLAMLGLFACITPAGLVLGAQLAGLDEHANAALTGLAAGTFLYVAVCDLLPEVFHHTDRRMPRVIALVIGVIASGLAPQFESFEALQTSIAHFGEEALATFLAMAPYLLLGFAIAGLVQVFVDPARLQRLFKGEGVKPVATASVLGAPLPLCSCSVIPVASGLRKAGAGKGPTSAFLIATPETGVDSVSVTYALFDPVMAVVRPVASVLSALVTGLAVGVFAKSSKDDEPNAGLDETVANPCCSRGDDANATNASSAGTSDATQPRLRRRLDADRCHALAERPVSGRRARLLARRPRDEPRHPDRDGQEPRQARARRAPRRADARDTRAGLRDRRALRRIRVRVLREAGGWARGSRGLVVDLERCRDGFAVHRDAGEASVEQADGSCRGAFARSLRWRSAPHSFAMISARSSRVARSNHLTSPDVCLV